MTYLVEMADGTFCILSPEKLVKHLSACRPVANLYRLCKGMPPLRLLVWRLNGGVWMVTDECKNMYEI